MRIRGTKRILLILLPIILVVCNSKPITVSSEDEQYIRAFIQDWHLNPTTDSIHTSFEKEVAFVQQVQKDVIRDIKHEEILQSSFGNVAYYYKNRKGFCYDRAVLLEKIFAYYGFPFRHVFVYFNNGTERSSLTTLFKRSALSHALLEVKTKNGWMVLGTNADWVGILNNNRVVDVKQLRKELGHGQIDLKYDITTGTCFWADRGNDFGVAYGLYSRHGNLFRERSNTTLSMLHFIPDYNLKMVLYNF